MTAFEAFVALQERLRRDRPDVIQLGETRIARALGAIKPDVAAPSQGTIHRCDLARAWCARRGMPAAWSARALVCEGVRHALSLLLPQLEAPVGLPRDVYPVYAQIAERVGVPTVDFATFPELDLERVWASGARHVVLPCPLKLHGRAWTDSELAAATRWLAGDAGRRLVLDGVYSFGQSLAPGVLALIETDQVIYLDSMSKGWLHEQVFGTAVVPVRDLERLAPVFRAAPPSQAKLAAGAALLAAATPAHVDVTLATLRAATIGVLASHGLSASAPTRGYLVPIACSAERALSDHGIVAIPLEVFGGAAGDWAFASALSLAGAP